MRSRCLLYEFEDVVNEVDSVDILAPRCSATGMALKRRVTGWLYRKEPRAAALLVPRVPAPRHRYDLLFFGCQSVGDLVDTLPMMSWLGAARRSVCYIEEMWEGSLGVLPTEMELLRRFDAVFVGCHASLPRLRALVERPCHYLAPSVDALRFAPTGPRRRVIDVYWMGRREPHRHENILEFARATGRFYLYDTSGDANVPSHFEHRGHLIERIQRSRYFIVQRAKVNVEDEVRGQEEVGFRFFEGAAGGAVLLGEKPRSSIFEELLGWEDSVIQVDSGPGGFRRRVEELDADTTRTDAIRWRNVVHCLLRHDHVYRWADVLRAVGLAPTPSMQRRVQRLAELAWSIDPVLTETLLRDPHRRIQLGPLYPSQVSCAEREGPEVPAAVVASSGTGS